MNQKFDLQQKFRGYQTKIDETTVDPLFLASGSKNCLINTEGDKVISRTGYSVFTDESEEDDAPISEKDWMTSTGEEFMFRFTEDGILQFYCEDISDSFVSLMTTLNGSYPTRFATVWNATELIDEILFVNHSSDLYSWTGAYGTLADDASVASGTVTIVETIAEQRFLANGTRSIMILDSGGVWRTTAYTGQSGSDFTVSTDLSGFTFDAGALVLQVPRTNANTPASGFTNDVIEVVNSQAYVGSHSSRVLYISANDDYTDFSFSTPRVPGEGAKLTLDDTTTALVVGQNAEQKESMVIFSGRDRGYYADFKLQAGSTADRESVSVIPIPGIGPRQAPQSQELVAKSKNTIVFINWDNEMNELGSVADVNTLQNMPISDPIKPDFAGADFTGGNIKFSKNTILVTAPNDSLVFIYDFQNKFWQPPQTIPIAMMTYFGSNLYGHSSVLRETYLLFDGLADRIVDGEGSTFTAIARFAYMNNGDRTILKNFDKYFTEAYMTRNLEMYHKLFFEYGGGKAIKGPYTYSGSDSNHIFAANPLSSLGVNSLGATPMGSPLDFGTEFIKYRRIKPITAQDHFEFQCEYSADILDSQFQIVAHGPNTLKSANFPVKITQ